MHTSKWKKVWKDKDFIILASGSFDENAFYESMREIAQKMFGTPNPSIFHRMKIPIGEEDED